MESMSAVQRGNLGVAAFRLAECGHRGLGVVDTPKPSLKMCTEHKLGSPGP